MELLLLGLKTTLLGMVIVFVCLFMLMIIINIMSSIMKRVKPKEEGPQNGASPQAQIIEEISTPMIIDEDSDEEIAVIAAVIAYLDAEGTSRESYTIGRPQRVKNSPDPWTVSARQDLINSKL